MSDDRRQMTENRKEKGENGREKGDFFITLRPPLFSTLCSLTSDL
jgi:hypothetical protein